MALIEVKVPDIGDFKEVTIIEVLVKAGDTIKAEQSLITVESDKASMEIPSSHAGVIKEMKVALGDKGAEGSLVLMLEVAGAAAAAPAPAAAAPAPAPVAAPAPAPVAAAPVAAAVAAAGPVEVFVPDIGDFDAVAVIELLVKVGDTVKAEQSLITVESDKASMEIPSSHAGVIKELKVKLGDKVSKGSLVAVLEGAAGAVAAPAPAAAAPAAAPVAAPAAAPAPAPAAAAPAAAAPKKQPAGGGGKGAVKAPMPGKILEVSVKPGETVKRGQQVAILEAMKMHNSLGASQDGVIAEVCVDVGQTVAHGDVIVTFKEG